MQAARGRPTTWRRRATVTLLREDQHLHDRPATLWIRSCECQFLNHVSGRFCPGHGGGECPKATQASAISHQPLLCWHAQRLCLCLSNRAATYMTAPPWEKLTSCADRHLLANEPFLLRLHYAGVVRWSCADCETIHSETAPPVQEPPPRNPKRNLVPNPKPGPSTSLYSQPRAVANVYTASRALHRQQDTMETISPPSSPEPEYGRRAGQQ